MSTPEGLIQTAICKELRKHQLFFWRTNNTPTYDPSIEGYRSMGEFALRGVPDIILVHNSTFYGLEIKTPKGAISPDQLLFKRRLERAGGQYHTLRSLDDLKVLLLTILSTID